MVFTFVPKLVMRAKRLGQLYLVDTRVKCANNPNVAHLPYVGTLTIVQLVQLE